MRRSHSGIIVPSLNRFVAVFALAGTLATAVPATGAPIRGLTAAPQVSRVYDAIFDARFEEVPELLAQTCDAPAPAPRRPARTTTAAPEVCQMLGLLALWWRIQLDPDATDRDAMFQSRAEASVAAMEMWTEREPERAEAWFYLGGAYAARVQWRVLRGQQLAAARDGKRIKDALERAIALDPGFYDAYFGIGLYHYYADVAPVAAKILRWLFLLPGGDRAGGMQEMLRARDKGQLLRSEADYQLHILDLWYEKKPEQALQLLGGLRSRYPHNPVFPQAIAEAEDVYLHDPTASLGSWRGLLEAARAGAVAEPGLTAVRARLGMARQLDQLFETDAAVEQLRTVVDARPQAPFGALAQAYLQLGRALDRLGDRRGAVSAYRSALDAAPPGDPLKIRGQTQAGLRTAPDPDGAAAYRLSIEGWRALGRGALADAARALTQSLALRPGDPVTRYRQARLFLAQRQDPAALTALEAIVRDRAATPPTVYASACIDAARLHEKQGSQSRALELYRTARDVFGADQQTKDTAQRAVSRLSLAAQAPPSR